MNDGLLTTEQLQQALGSRPYRFDVQIGSTNDLARDWALSGAPDGSVVVAEEQTKGRGRFGRSWNAPAGTALLFSVILRPDAADTHLSRVMMVGAVAAADALTDLTSELPDAVNLKWPNDVLLTGRKVAGILPEAIWQGEQLVAAILGIGLNVSVDFTATPLADRAISIETITQRSINRAVLLGKLLQGIDMWSALLGDPALVVRWRAYLSTVGQRVIVTAADRQVQGLAADVDDDGALLVRADDGTIHRVIAGEVTLAE